MGKEGGKGGKRKGEGGEEKGEMGGERGRRRERWGREGKEGYNDISVLRIQMSSLVSWRTK